MLNLRKLLAKRNRQILAVEFDGYRLRAVLVRAEAEQVVVQRASESRAVDPFAALSEAIDELGRTDLPRRAILLVPKATPAVLELPVDPKHPRPAAQMQELVHWELETHMTQQIGTGRLGQIMIGRGYLSYPQIELGVHAIIIGMFGALWTSSEWTTEGRVSDDVGQRIAYWLRMNNVNESFRWLFDGPQDYATYRATLAS